MGIRAAQTQVRELKKHQERENSVFPVLFWVLVIGIVITVIILSLNEKDDEKQQASLIVQRLLSGEEISLEEYVKYIGPKESARSLGKRLDLSEDVIEKLENRHIAVKLAQ